VLHHGRGSMTANVGMARNLHVMLHGTRPVICSYSDTDSFTNYVTILLSKVREHCWKPWVFSGYGI
jgi:hypothetical protein